MHITGGAFTKVKDILDKADAVISHPKKLAPQKIFQDMYTKGLSNKGMYSTFNCGIGFVLSVSKQEAPQILSALKSAAVVGEVVAGAGQVKIHSAFDGKTVLL